MTPEITINFSQDELNILYGILEFTIQQGKLNTVQAVAYIHGKVIQAIELGKQAAQNAEIPLTPTEEVKG